MLRHSHRFSAASGIGQLAAAVNAGDYGAGRPSSGGRPMPISPCCRLAAPVTTSALQP
jgi:ATP-dependent exoDNAse (exonuclease V) alpha subunit